MELEKAGAHVTVIYRGSDYPKAVKPWILPNFESLVKHEKINMAFNAEVTKITEDSVIYEQDGEIIEIPNDYILQ